MWPSRRDRPRCAAVGESALLETARDEFGYHAPGLGGLPPVMSWLCSSSMILARPAATISDLSAKFDALAWLLLADGAVLDHEAERQVRRFGRELRRLGAAEGEVHQRQQG